jgi:hypothetical protein
LTIGQSYKEVVMTTKIAIVFGFTLLADGVVQVAGAPGWTEVVIALIGLASLWITYQVNALKSQQTETHSAVNHRLDQLEVLWKASAHQEGVDAEAARRDALTPEQTKILAKAAEIPKADVLPIIVTGTSTSPVPPVVGPSGKPIDLPSPVTQIAQAADKISQAIVQAADKMTPVVGPSGLPVLVPPAETEVLPTSPDPVKARSHHKQWCVCGHGLGEHTADGCGYGRCKCKAFKATD